jgi:GSH-dependent disulfide-bond oxidoreductase
MIELFYVASPNVHKICVALEEMELAHRLTAVDVSRGDHHDPGKLGGAATGKLPVIRDEAPADGGEPMVVFESGAILQYLAGKTGRFLSPDPRARQQETQWLFWQMAGLGPIGGQLWHFMAFAPQIAPDFDNSYALGRYRNMWSALWRTMDARLADVPFLGGAYSIADMACYPWVLYIDPQEGADAYPHVCRWRDAISARPAVAAAYRRAFTLDTGYARNEAGATLFPMDGILKHVVVT